MHIDGAKLKQVFRERLEGGFPTVGQLSFQFALDSAWDDVIQPVIDIANGERTVTVPMTHGPGGPPPCG